MAETGRIAANDLEALDLDAHVCIRTRISRRCTAAGRSCSRAAKACTSGTTTASSTSRRWPGSGARRSVTATTSSRARRTSRSRSCRSRICSRARATSPEFCSPTSSSRMAPFAASRVFFGNSGSDANDTQIKLVWYYNNALGRPKKKKIIARLKGYHGTTLGVGGAHGLAVVSQAVRRAAAAVPAHGRALLLSRRGSRARARKTTRRGSRTTSSS